MAFSKPSPSVETLQLSKGIGKLEETFQSWKLLEESVSLPAAVLNLENVHYNLDWMEEFLNKFDASLVLAPHGKTTMMPFLFKEVLQHPSTWGLTLASPSQVKVAHSFGTSRVIMANQLVGKRNCEIISEILENDDKFEFYCIVDSVQNADQLGRFFSQKKQSINVLLEFGMKGGRTGIRNETQLKEVLQALGKWKHCVHVAGIEFFEGIIPDVNDTETISTFIDSILRQAEVLIEASIFHEGKPVIITGSGSSWVDIVAKKFAKFSKDHNDLNLQLILRPGCYMIHDSGTYSPTSKRIIQKNLMDRELLTSLKVWTYVQSIPEPNLAILTLGRRDAGHDSGFPKPSLHFRPEEGNPPPIPTPCIDKDWTIFKMMDQHAFLRIREEDDIKVGDMLGCDILHPCTTFDKWRNIVVINNEREFNVVGVHPTYF